METVSVEEAFLPYGALREDNLMDIVKSTSEGFGWGNIERMIEKGGGPYFLFRPGRSYLKKLVDEVGFFFNVEGDGKNHLEEFGPADRRELEREAGRYPVIRLSFDLESAETPEALSTGLKNRMIHAFEEHSELDAPDNAAWREIVRGEDMAHPLGSLLGTLSGMLSRHWGEPAVLLIEDADRPFQLGLAGGFADEAFNLASAIIRGAVKDNPDMAMAVITGTIPFRTGTIFSGFTGIEDSVMETRRKRILENREGEYEAYVSPELGRVLRGIYDSSEDVFKSDMEALLAGDSITMVLDDSDVYRGLVDRLPTAFWKALVFLGCLKVMKMEESFGSFFTAELRVPDEEAVKALEAVFL